MGIYKMHLRITKCFNSDMVEFNRGSWMAVKQKQLVKNTCKFSLQWGNPEWFKMTTETIDICQLMRMVTSLEFHS